MSRADDVASLFQRFGANSDGYLEIDNTFDYREPPATKPIAHAQPMTPAIVEVTPAALATPDEPEPATIAASSSPLGHLLTEAARARQAEAAARNTEALVQALPKTPSAQIDAHVIAVISAKGGVGKSTLSAALATAIRLPDGLTVAIDLDPQNALQHLLNVSPDVAGMAAASLTGDNWHTLLATGSGDTSLLRHGAQTPDERRALERYLDNDPQWLVRQIARMELGANDVVILDVPGGDERMLQQALNAATQVLAVVTADAACYLTLDQLDARLASVANDEPMPAWDFVINRFDESRSFSCDMAQVITRRLGDRLLGVVHQDPALDEALAFGHNPLQAPGAGRGVQDLRTLADTLASRLVAQSAEESVQP